MFKCFSEDAACEIDLKAYRPNSIKHCRDSLRPVIKYKTFVRKICIHNFLTNQ